MKVVIKEKEFSYTSDFPDDWSKSSIDSYKCPVAIGRYQTFIKRFEKRKPGDISGWSLLLKLKGKFSLNLPQVYDAVQTEEYRKEIWYVFYEYLNARTLDEIIINDVSVDLKKLTGDLFTGLQSLHNYGYWFAQFSEKSILFDEQRRRFLLIDLDTAKSLSKVPGKDSERSNSYLNLAFRFCEEIAGNTEIENISGAALNYLEAVFLVLSVKLTLTAKKYEYKSNELNGVLPALLNKADPEFKKIFEKTLFAGNHDNYLQWTNQVKELVFSKIIDNSIEDVEVISRPVIKNFGSDKYEVGNKESFLLSWQVQNAESLEVYRNEVLYKKLNNGENSIKITESFDGRPRKIDYTLLAISNTGGTRSQPITITISDKVGRTEETVITEPQSDVVRNADTSPLRRDNTSKLRTIRVTLLALLLSILVTGSVITYYLVRPKTKFSILKPEATEGSFLVIFGNNIPKDSSTLQVYFNKIKSQIAEYSPSSIKVIVPQMGEDTGAAKVAVVVKGDTSYASLNFLVKSKPVVKPVDITPVAATVDSHSKDPELPFSKVVIPLRKNAKKKEKSTTSVTNTPQVTNVEKQPEIIKEKPKKVINIYELVSVSSNDFKRKTFGGVKNLKVTVKNASAYELDAVVVEISYQKNNEKEVKKETLLFNSVKAHGDATLEAPSTNRGKKVQLKIISVKSNQMNKDME